MANRDLQLGDKRYQKRHFESPGTRTCCCFIFVVVLSGFSGIIKNMGDQTMQTKCEISLHGALLGVVVLGASSQDFRTKVVSNHHLQAMKRPFGRGPTTPVRELTITMVINHLQVMVAHPPSEPQSWAHFWILYGWSLTRSTYRNLGF